MKISAVILTKNEETNILDCIETLEGVGEIIIIDDNSTDRTIEVVKAKNLPNIKIKKRSLSNDFSAQRNFGISQASYDWVLFVDADERVSSDLLKEIENKIMESSKNGFYIKRTDVMWGKKMKHGEVGNIRLLRLAKRNAGKWKGDVHEIWEVEGALGQLKNEFVHLPHQTIREFISRVSFYSTLRAKELYKKKTQVSLLQIIFYPKLKFFLNYFVKFGFLDGIPGFNIAVIMSFHSFLVRSKLWLLNNS